MSEFFSWITYERVQSPLGLGTTDWAGRSLHSVHLHRAPTHYEMKYLQRTYSSPSADVDDFISTKRDETKGNMWRQTLWWRRCVIVVKLDSVVPFIWDDGHVAILPSDCAGPSGLQEFGYLESSAPPIEIFHRGRRLPDEWISTWKLDVPKILVDISTHISVGKSTRMSS